MLSFKIKKMKILHLICTDGIGGAEKHLNYLLPGMAAYNYECHLIIVHPSASTIALSNFADQLKEKGVKTTLIKTENILSISVIKEIKNYLQLNKINTIHSHLLRSDVLAVLLKKFFLKKIYLISTKHGYEEAVVSNYNPDNFKPPKNFHYYVTKYCLKNIDQNISISHCISQLSINFNLTKAYYKVIYHGVNVEFDNIEVDCFKSSGPKLIIVGRLEPLKGHKYVIEAMKIVLEKIPNVQLFIIGDGSYKEKLQEITEQNGLVENIKFLGFKTNALAYMKQADLVIVPSLFEAFGLVFIEAIGLKKCIIAFDVPAGNEILNNQIAQLIPKGNVIAMAEKIIELLANNEKKLKIENNAYVFYIKNFTTSIMIKNTAAFYDSLKLVPYI